MFDYKPARVQPDDRNSSALRRSQKFPMILVEMMEVEKNWKSLDAVWMGDTKKIEQVVVISYVMRARRSGVMNTVVLQKVGE